ncbi:hypothetical protein [Pedobacter jejuensis]|uniref:Lipocalin-like domain-containing protein n=1 Tax=Pedobacter jejuensis TaxID=1268550 RepID=A0A3N0BLR8_9SPHI|nr:hypothetical protein [Pedobacter jejuensis]RNL49691.1 hypothetical protein D7004_19975 [Pedobacter jejuensis]
MKNLLLLFLIGATLTACKKDADKTLATKNWKIESVTVSPAITIGGKTSTNYIELMGQASCAANMMISFNSDGTFTSGSNGALCDMAQTTAIQTWKRNDDQIILSSSSKFPMVLAGNKLTQVITSEPQGGIVYTYVYVYKAESK